MAVTVRDVARHAGVSPATVSLVLNETPGQRIHPQTRERVRAAAAELGYAPNRIARALREGSARIVLLRTGPLLGGSLSSLIAGMEAELREHGHTLLVSHQQGEQHAGERADDDILRAVAPRSVVDLGELYRSGAADGARKGRGADSRGDGGWVDGLARHTATQLEHLLRRGRRRIAYAHPAVGLESLVELRAAHMNDWLRRHGLPAAVRVTVPEEREGAAAAVLGLLGAHPDVDAVAAFSDDVAIGVLAGCAAEGVPVPGRLAVIGFDEGRLGRLWTPSLTTVRIDAEGYGRRLARSVLGLEPRPRAHRPSEVVVRESA
ncbi:MAG: LacI family DNA-binding transcriptional regulator [Microbacteriaceae bacterium]